MKPFWIRRVRGSAGFEAAKTAISGIDWGGVGSTIASGISGAIDGLAKLGSGIWDTITGWFGGGDEEKAKGDAKTSGGQFDDRHGNRSHRGQRSGHDSGDQRGKAQR